MAKKGARRSGGTGTRRRAADQERAARMRGTVRNTGNCPICHRLVPNGNGAHGHDCGSKKS